MKEFVLIKSEFMSNLFAGTDDRVDILEQIGDEVRFIEGIHIVEEWRKFYGKIKSIWLSENTTEVVVDEQDIVIMAFYFDLVAQFFLYNGGDEDTPYLKSVSQFFDTHNKVIGQRETSELFRKAFAKP